MWSLISVSSVWQGSPASDDRKNICEPVLKHFCDKNAVFGNKNALFAIFRIESSVLALKVLL